jgi:hypothetical protein
MPDGGKNTKKKFRVREKRSNNPFNRSVFFCKLRFVILGSARQGVNFACSRLAFGTVRALMYPVVIEPCNELGDEIGVIGPTSLFADT